MKVGFNDYLFCLLISISLLLRILDYLYYKDSDRILHIIKLRKIKNIGKVSYYRKYDYVFCVFPFLWSWIDIVSASIVFNNVNSYFLYFLIIVFIGGRFRALQEASHVAVHYGLCRSKSWQWFLSNIFFQYPCFKPDMHYRQIAHVCKHHRYPNELGKDPNIDRFISVGFIPGISKLNFYLKLMHPLTISGLKETLLLIYKGFFLNSTKKNGILRLFIVIFLLILFSFFSGFQGLFILYILPLIITYPLFSWISLLVEHRWFVNCKETDRYLKECINARPTYYKGLLGWLIKHLIFPGTDHYHLAHSLYPIIRWNYMKVIDIELQKKCPYYIRYASEGLLFINGTKPSALSELRDRMTCHHEDDLITCVDK